MTWLYMYCANCGCDGGRVLESSLPETFAFYLCIPCGEKWAPMAGYAMMPDEVFFDKVKQAMIEEYGRELTSQEIIEVLKDENSILYKLALERK